MNESRYERCQIVERLKQEPVGAEPQKLARDPHVTVRRSVIVSGNTADVGENFYLFAISFICLGGAHIGYPESRRDHLAQHTVVREDERVRLISVRLYGVRPGGYVIAVYPRDERRLTKVRRLANLLAPAARLVERPERSVKPVFRHIFHPFRQVPSTPAIIHHNILYHKASTPVNRCAAHLCIKIKKKAWRFAVY